MEIKIVIPSHKRSDRLLTSKVVQAIVCVPESQLSQYRAANRDAEIVTHPDTVIGLAAKRNWICKHFGSVMMLDDDITAFRRLYTPPGVEADVGPERAAKIIQEAAYCAEQAGAYLFGFSHICNPIVYSGLKPIQLSGFITGCATGVLAGSKLWFNPEIKACEDYWVSCLNAYHHRIIWKDMRYSFVQKDTFVSPGGQAEFRNMDSEKKDYDCLVRCFGSDVVQLKTDTRLAKRKHEYQKTLKFPF
jgi:hypothetical protein